MDLLETHPNLAPGIVKLLSESLSTAQAKTKELESSLAEKEASILAAGDLNGREISMLKAEIEWLQTELDAAQVKDEPIDMHTTQFCNEMYDELKAKILSVEADKNAIIDDLCKQMEDRDNTLASFRSTSQTQSAELRRARDEHTRDLDDADRLRTELRQVRENYMREKDHFKGLRTTYEGLCVVVAQREGEIEALKKSNQELRSEHSEKFAKFKTGVMEEAEAVRWSAATIGRQSENARQQLAAEGERQRQALKQKETEIENLQNIISNDKTRAVEMRNELKSNRQEIDRLKDVNLTVYEERQRLQQTLQDSKSELDEMRRKYEEEKGEWQSLEKTLISDVQEMRRKYENEEIEKHRLEKTFSSELDEMRCKYEKEEGEWHMHEKTFISELDEMRCKYEEEKVELQEKYEGSIKHYMDIVEQSAVLVKEYEQKNAEAIAAKSAETCAEDDRFLKLDAQNKKGREQLTQDIAKQRESYEKELETYKKHVADLKQASVLLFRSIRKMVSDLRLPPPFHEERLVCCEFMATFPRPARPNIGRSIYKVANPNDYFEHSLRGKRKSVHYPMRQMWADPHFIHALIFAPDERYRSNKSSQSSESTPSTRTPPCIASLCGQECDLFVTSITNDIFYFGIYLVHSLRNVHVPGSPIPPDVSPDSIRRAMVDSESGRPSTEPIAHSDLRTECFGLQCIGYDSTLYKTLLDVSEGKLKKRKASSIGVQPGQQTKSQKTQ
ncbi:hypothetical protein C8R43DRAFT_1236926 [Mycena crocata]|nr:hypothetical protein C8R43DRAFT_1236926 [Mycena crocata]